MKHVLPEPRTRILAVGKTGTGKSNRAKEYVRWCLGKGARVAALDPFDEYSVEGRESGLVRLGSLRQRLTAAQLAADPHTIKDARLSLAVVPMGKSPREWARAFLLLAKLARAAGKPVLLVLDEVGTWCDASFGPECAAAKAELAALANGGRHDGIALLMISQRASGVPKAARTQVSEVWAFRQDEPSDLEALAERLGEEKAGAVARLSVGDCLEWRDAEPTPQQPTNPKLKAV